MNYDNPAARLLSILERVKDFPQKHSCLEVWQILLDTKDNVTLVDRLGKLMSLPRQIVLALQEDHPDADGTWDHWANVVNGAFMVQNLHGHWESFRNNIDANTLTMLRLSASLLRAKTNTALVETEQLLALREELSEILSSVLGAPIAPEIKKYLTRRLREIITMIEEYKLTGALPLLDEIETTVAHCAFDPGYRAFLTDTDLGKRLLENLAALANVVTVAVGVPQLAQAIQKLLH